MPRSAQPAFEWFQASSPWWQKGDRWLISKGHCIWSKVHPPCNSQLRRCENVPQSQRLIPGSFPMMHCLRSYLSGYHLARCQRRQRLLWNTIDIGVDSGECHLQEGSKKQENATKYARLVTELFLLSVAKSITSVLLASGLNGIHDCMRSFDQICTHRVELFVDPARMPARLSLRASPLVYWVFLSARWLLPWCLTWFGTSFDILCQLLAFSCPCCKLRRYGLSGCVDFASSPHAVIDVLIQFST